LGIGDWGLEWGIEGLGIGKARKTKQQAGRQQAGRQQAGRQQAGSELLGAGAGKIDKGAKTQRNKESNT